jgi:hypothetical protein
MTLKFKFPLFEIGWIDRLEGRSQLVQTLNSELDPMSIGFIKETSKGLAINIIIITGLHL